MKKYIWLILNLSSWFLKQLTEMSGTTDSGRLFQRFRTLTEKKWSLTSHLLCSFTSFQLRPRVRLPSAFELHVKFLHFPFPFLFTALNGMQTRSNHENSVCLSVRPSVCHTRGLWQNGRKICPDLYTIWKNI